MMLFLLFLSYSETEKFCKKTYISFNPIILVLGIYTQELTIQMKIEKWNCQLQMHLQ